MSSLDLIFALTEHGKAALVFYCRPFTAQILVHDVAAEHVPTLEDRMDRGAFSPRVLWEARPELWRPATEAEIERATHGASWQIHDWMVLPEEDA